MNLFDLERYVFNPYALPPILVGILIAVLGLFVLVREKVSAVSVAFCGMTGAGALWLLSYGGIFCARDSAAALTWCRIENLGVAFIPLAVYLFTLTVTGTLARLRLSLFFTALLSAGFAFSVLFTDGFVAGTQKFFWGYFARYGWISWIFLVFFAAVLGGCLRLLYRDWRAAPSVTHACRLRAFLLAFGVSYLGSVDYLPAFGVPVYPFGYLPVFLFLIIAARTIWRYHLVDITPEYAASQILRTMSDGLLVVDREGIIRLVNQAASHLFRKSEAELTGMPVWMLQGGFFSEERLRAFLRARVVRGYAVSYLDEQGGRLFLEMSASSLLDGHGDPVAVVCILRDVTERHRAEETLRRAKTEAA